MSKGGKPKTEITRYYLSIHFGICYAVDKILAIIVKEKDAWTGNMTSNGTIAISQAELFGGDKKEGGLEGNVEFLRGAADQVLPDALAVKLGRANGADCPGYRSISSLFFYGSGSRGFYWTANSPFVPGVWCKVQREPIGPA